MIAVGLLILSVLSPLLTGTSCWVNPISIFNFPHALLLLSYVSALSKNIVTLELTDNTVALLGISYLAYNFGVLGMSIPLHLAKKRNTKVRPISFVSIRGVLSPVFWLFLVAVAVKYSILLQKHPNPIASIISIRADYTTGVLNYYFFNNVALLASFLLMLNFGILLGAKQNIQKSKFFCAILLTVLNDITIGGAYWTFSALIFLFSGWSVATETYSKISRTIVIRLASVVLSVLCVVYVLMQFRTQGTITAGVSFSEVILLYAGGDIASFGYFVDHPYPSLFPGRNTFGGLYQIAEGIFSLIGASFLPPLNGQDFIADVGMLFNTTISFSHYYSDFGSTGLVISSFLTGIISMSIMIFLRKKPSIVKLQLTACMIFFNFISIRSVPTEGAYFWILLVIFPVSHWLYLSRPGSRRNRNLSCSSLKSQQVVSS